MLEVLSGPLTNLIDNLFETDEERANAKLKLLSAEMQPILGQLAVNRAEATNPNMFVSGWRPFIGWSCGLIFIWNYIIAVFLHWSLLAMGIPVPVIPTLGIDQITPVLMGMLGLGGLRTFEKYTGSEANR